MKNVDGRLKEIKSLFLSQDEDEYMEGKKSNKALLHLWLQVHYATTHQRNSPRVSAHCKAFPFMQIV
jgi:hypothetical protein